MNRIVEKLLQNCFVFLFLYLTDFRKQARQLENDIDAKLVSFSKLGLNAASIQPRTDEAPLLNEEHFFETMSSEIESLLAKVNDRLFHLLIF